MIYSLVSVDMVMGNMLRLWLCLRWKKGTTRCEKSISLKGRVEVSCHVGGSNILHGANRETMEVSRNAYTIRLTSFCINMTIYTRTNMAKDEKTDSLSNGEFLRFDFATIRSSTANFSRSNWLGEGRFGDVYKGTLESGKEIAIKRLRYDMDLSPEIFMTECRIMARIQHTNLVKHLGFCLERATKYMVYEFLPNATLASFLFDPRKRVLINWETWHKIILGIAQGLEYLHDSTGTHPRMLHHNLTTSNVLLDAEMNPKIVEFGVNRLFESRRQHTNTCSVAIGTYAYIAPEYYSTGRYTVKSDVYSFGVIVLETVSNLNRRKSNQSIITDAYRIQARELWDEERLSDLINPALSGKCSETDVIRCMQVGLLCVQGDAEHRPTMEEVLLMLTGKVAIALPSTPVV